MKNTQPLFNCLFVYSIVYANQLVHLRKKKVEIDQRKCLLCQSDEKVQYREPNIETAERVIVIANKKIIHKVIHASEPCNKISENVSENNCIFGIMETPQNKREQDKDTKSYSNW